MAVENDMAMENYLSVEDRKLMDHFKELLRKATANNIGESSTSSLQVEAFGEDSEVPSITVPYETEYEIIVTSAVEVFNLFLELFSSEEAMQAFGSDKALPALLVCNRVILYASKLSRMSGKDENIVMYLEQVVEYMEKNPGVGSAELRCLLLYACAKVFKKQGRTDKALRGCNSAREVTLLIANELTKIPLEIAISLLLVEINGIQGDPEELFTEVNRFLKLQHLFLGWIDLVGFIREIPAAVASDRRMTIRLIEALDTALSTRHGDRSCAAILLSLCNYYGNTSYPYRHHASQILIEQAILGLQQEKCKCRSDYKVYPSAFYREEECACHQLLADAWSYQGFLQQEMGLLEGAEQSFQQGLKLSQSCKDKDRECSFHFVLHKLLLSKTHLYGNYGLPRIEEIPHDSFRQLSGAMRFHFLEFLKIAESPEASRGKDIAITFLKTLGSLEPKPNSLEYMDSHISSSMEFLKKKERSGDFMDHASTHAELSSICIRKGDITSAREHFLLGLKHWKEGGMGEIYFGQVLGQIALRPEIMELDHAYDIWYRVYNWTQKQLEEIALINEEDALHYFETIKHASMSLAKCEMLKFGNLVNSTRDETFVKIYNRSPLEAKEYWLKAFQPLLWAERGKGKMLMSYIGAIQKNFDSKVEDSRLLERLNLPSDYPVDFESCFSKDDHFALDFLQGRPRTSQRVIFIEYTCIDNKHLMTHITSGSGDGLHSRILDLSVAIDQEIRDEAEKELDSLRKPSHSNVGVGSQPFVDPNTPGSSSRKEVSSGAEAANKVLSAMNKYGTNRVPFNRWIPGMVAGIQRRVTKVQLLRKRNKSILIQKVEREIRELLQTLHRILIKPVENYLFMGSSNDRDIATLVFVPHEDLGVVPFAALHEQDGSAFLIEQFAISVSPAIWCSRHCEYLYEKKVRSDQAEGAPLLVGRKSGYKPPFEDLVEAHKEVQAVSKALGSTACKKVLDDSDSPDMRSGMKECVKEYLPNASWIHFSVHGEISPQFPQGSLLFGDNDDQRLTANEIITSAASSPWRARCAIASACQSGLGSVAGGGIMGFARSFILAGIPSCVLSMWEVNETFCTSFMEKLYCNLQSEETLGHAMRNTMICMMKEPVEKYIVNPPPTKKKPQSKRFKEPKTPSQPHSGEPMWSILDWAAFSCFGFPGVKLVTESVVAKSNAKGKSPMDESAHDPLPAQHQEVDRHLEQEFFKATRRREIANLADGSADEASFGGLFRPDRSNSAIPSLGTQAGPVRNLTQNPMQAPHVTYNGPSMIFTLFPIHEKLPPDYRLATVQEARDNRQALLKQMPRELIANLADGSVHGASHGGSIREETWRYDFHYKLATQHPIQADPRPDPSVANAGTGMTFLPFPLGEELPPQYRLATLQEVRDNREALLRAMPGWQIANLADGSVDGDFYGGRTRGKGWRNGVTHNLATQDLQQVDPGWDPSVTKAGMDLTFALVPIAEELPSQYRLATVQDVRDNREALYRAMPNWEIANLADGSVDGACYGGFTRTERRDHVDYKLAASYRARASPTPDPTEANPARRDPGQDYRTRREPSVTAMARPGGLTFSLFRVDEVLPPHYRLATVREVRDNRGAWLRAMPGWEIANLADGSVDGASYGGHTRMDIRNDVGHRLATLLDNRLERLDH